MEVTCMLIRDDRFVLKNFRLSGIKKQYCSTCKVKSSLIIFTDGRGHLFLFCAVLKLLLRSIKIVNDNSKICPHKN